ncbi:MAG: UDP-N-acetylmuramoyl-L-alanine--D-glutamate ligase [Verrucomicrobia bacterium]|nr:UDP-N-acetylmuramoyl-L-alanine--D-glutamate ligase [Verrucomicrobiota bacterium]
MNSLANKSVLVAGLGASGVAACELLLKRGARVTAVDSGDGKSLRELAGKLHEQGVKVSLGAKAAPVGEFDLAVVSPGVPLELPLMRELAARKVPVIGELELGFQNSSCLNISITGTNGKTTTTELVARILAHTQRKTVAAGNIGLPLCAVADQTKELDFLTLEVSSFQLETIQFFRPSVAVLLNITPDHLDRYDSMDDYRRAKARLFENQQAFDWAIVQGAALAQLTALGVKLPSKVVTFSATDSAADIHFDRGLLISRVEGWEGPLLDMNTCQLRGPHNAENLMAALAVSRTLRLPLETTIEALRTYAPGSHRCELVAEINGVKFVNDSKATNVDAVAKAIQSMPAGPDGPRNVWLIAGGKDKGFDYHEVGPLLAQRVKGALLLGETREKIRAAWSLFTPCTVVDSLLEAVSKSAGQAVAGDVVLLSPACSSFDMFRNYQQRGEFFSDAVRAFGATAGGGAPAGATTNGAAAVEAGTPGTRREPVNERK